MGRRHIPRRSGAEAIIGSASGVSRSRDIRRVLSEGSWDRAAVDACTVTFRQYISPSIVPKEPFDIPVIPHPQAQDSPQVDVGGGSRRMMLRSTDFRAHGYTAGCPGCVSLQSGKKTKRNHTEVCRARVEAEIVKTPEGELRNHVRACVKKPNSSERFMKKRENSKRKISRRVQIRVHGGRISESDA